MTTDAIRVELQRAFSSTQLTRLLTAAFAPGTLNRLAAGAGAPWVVLPASRQDRQLLAAQLAGLLLHDGTPPTALLAALNDVLADERDEMEALDPTRLHAGLDLAELLDSRSFAVRILVCLLDDRPEVRAHGRLLHDRMSEMRDVGRRLSTKDADDNRPENDPVRFILQARLGEPVEVMVSPQLAAQGKLLVIGRRSGVHLYSLTQDELAPSPADAEEPGAEQGIAAVEETLDAQGPQPPAAIFDHADESPEPPVESAPPESDSLQGAPPTIETALDADLEGLLDALPDDDEPGTDATDATGETAGDEPEPEADAVLAADMVEVGATEPDENEWKALLSTLSQDDDDRQDLDDIEQRLAEIESMDQLDGGNMSPPAPPAEAPPERHVEASMEAPKDAPVETPGEGDAGTDEPTYPRVLHGERIVLFGGYDKLDGEYRQVIEAFGAGYERHGAAAAYSDARIDEIVTNADVIVVLHNALRDAGAMKSVVRAQEMGRRYFTHHSISPKSVGGFINILYREQKI